MSPKGKVKATVVDIALLFAALTLKETWRFVIDLQKDAGMDIRPGSGSRDELEALIFVAFCHDLCLQSTAFGIYGKLLSQRFRETLALWKETSGAFPSISGYDLLFMMDQRFEEYYLAMKATDPLVKVGAVFTRHVGGCHDVIISTRAAICLRATLEFLGPVGNQYEIIEPEVAQIPRSAVAPTIQAHLKRMED